MEKEQLKSIILTFLSVFFSVIYNFIYTCIEEDIDNATVLCIRGFTQVVTMGVWAICMGISFTPSKGWCRIIKKWIFVDDFVVRLDYKMPCSYRKYRYLRRHNILQNATKCATLPMYTSFQLKWLQNSQSLGGNLKWCLFG